MAAQVQVEKRREVVVSRGQGTGGIHCADDLCPLFRRDQRAELRQDSLEVAVAVVPALPQGEIVRRPTRRLAGAARFMKGVEKFVAKERMPHGERIPCPRLDRPQRIDDFHRGRVFLQSTRSDGVLTAADYSVDRAVPGARARPPMLNLPDGEHRQDRDCPDQLRRR